jgi:hypothetical protein
MIHHSRCAATQHMTARQTLTLCKPWANPNKTGAAATHNHVRCRGAHNPVAGAAAAAAAGKTCACNAVAVRFKVPSHVPHTTQVLSHPLSPVWKQRFE